MLKNLKMWALAATVALATAACSSTEEKVGPQIPAGEKTAVKLNLSVAPAAASSTVNNVWVLQWDAAGNNKICHKERFQDTSKPLEITLLAGNDMKVAVIANVGDGTVYQLGTSYADFCQKTYPTKITNEAQIPYSGIQQVSITKAGQAIDLPLKWIAAKVSFKIASSTAGYTLKSAQVKNLISPIFLLPSTTATPAYAASDIVLTEFDKEYSYYTGENLQGTEAGITSAKDRVTTKKAVYVEAIGTKTVGDKRVTATFVSFYGNNDTDNFDVNSGSSYSQALAIDFDAQDDKRVTKTETDASINLAEVANSYMLSPTETVALGIPVSRVNDFWIKVYDDDRYAIDNGVNSGAVKKWVAKIIWETEPNLITFNTAEGKNANGYFSILPGSAAKAGNVLIGLFDATSTSDIDPKTAKVLWSWHIWVTDYNPGGDVNGPIPTVSGDPGRTAVANGFVHYFSSLSANRTADGSQPVIMDRDLGALTSDPTNLQLSTGVYYQWGRKDPFHTKRHTDSEFPAGGYEFGSPTNGFVPGATDHFEIEEGPIGLQKSIQNPKVFVVVTKGAATDDQAAYDWLKQGNDNDNLWYNPITGKKTMYDPCPPGWMVPHDTKSFESLEPRNVWEPSWFDPNNPGDKADEWGYYNPKLNPLQGIVCWDNLTRFYSPNSGRINSFNGRLFEYGDSQYISLSTAITKKNAAVIYQHSSMGYNIKEDKSMIENTFLLRTSGVSVRCVKE